MLQVLQVLQVFFPEQHLFSFLECEMNSIRQILEKPFSELTDYEKVFLKREYFRRNPDKRGNRKPYLFLATVNGKVR